MTPKSSFAVGFAVTLGACRSISGTGPLSGPVEPGYDAGDAGTGFVVTPSDASSGSTSLCPSRLPHEGDLCGELDAGTCAYFCGGDVPSAFASCVDGGWVVVPDDCYPPADTAVIDAADAGDAD